MATNLRDQPDFLLLDTGPFLTWCAVLYLDREKAGVSRRGEMFRSIRQNQKREFSRRDEESLKLACEKRQPRTTPHVIAEALKFRGQSALKRIASEFRSFVLELVREKKLVEMPVPTSHLAETEVFTRLVAEYGITDAALIWCVETYHCTLLIDDGRLFKGCMGDTSTRVHMLDVYLEVGSVR